MKRMRNFFMPVYPSLCGFLLCSTHTIFFFANLSTVTKQIAVTACKSPYLKSGILSNQLKIITSPHRLGGNMLRSGFRCGGLITVLSPSRFKEAMKFSI